jgi:hypothetical protein
MERWYAFRNMRKDRKEARREAIRIERLQAHSDLDYWKLHLRDALLLAIGGPKGAITLALVFTIPMLAAEGVNFPERDIITFVASGTIMLSLLFTSFSMPVLSPKKPVELAQEDELDTISDILRSVAQQVVDSTIVDEPGDRMIIDSVTRQYYQRIRRLRDQSNIENPEDTRLQILMAEWERDYILSSVVKGRLGFWSALFALNQLARQHARMLHRSPILPMIRSFGSQIASHFECWKLGRDSNVETGSHFEQPMRLRMPDLQIGIRENSLLKLQLLLEQSHASIAAESIAAEPAADVDADETESAPDAGAEEQSSGDVVQSLDTMTVAVVAAAGDAEAVAAGDACASDSAATEVDAGAIDVPDEPGVIGDTDAEDVGAADGAVHADTAIAADYIYSAEGVDEVDDDAGADSFATIIESPETVSLPEQNFSEQIITQMIATIRRQIERLNHAVSARQILAVSARAQMARATPVVQAELERKEIRLSMQALEWEREAITRALRAGRISAKTARQMLDNVAIMELDIEALLQ